MFSLPKNLYSVAQVKALDQQAVAQAGGSGYDLMCRAGKVAFDIMRKRWPQAKSLSILCGGGNNAGDGYVVARLAAEQDYDVTVYYLSDPSKLSGAAQQAYRDYRDRSGKLSAYQAGTTLESDVIVDALLGIGLERPVSGLWLAAIHAINQSPAEVLAIDVPSGLDADTGGVRGAAVRAQCTVTFIGLKRGLFTGAAPDYVGELLFDDLQVRVPHQTQADCQLLDAQALGDMPRRKARTHKGNNGRVLVIGGNHGMSGAPVLAGLAALRGGAGLVQIALRSGPHHMVAPPELMIHAVETTKELHVILRLADVVVIGPGLGQDEWALSMLSAALDSGKPLVVDADGLNLLACEPSTRTDWVLTPHPGEAGRLLGCRSGDIQADRFAAVARMQAQYGGTVVLKGAGTLIAGETVQVCSAGNPGMATAGMGDVLSGVIAALIGQGLNFDAAAARGVWVHATAADHEAMAHGTRGMMATDLLPHIRKLLNV